MPDSDLLKAVAFCGNEVSRDINFNIRTNIKKKHGHDYVSFSGNIVFRGGIERVVLINNIQQEIDAAIISEYSTVCRFEIEASWHFLDAIAKIFIFTKEDKKISLGYIFPQKRIPNTGSVNYAIVHYKNTDTIFMISHAKDSIQANYHSKGLFYEQELLEALLEICPQYSFILDIGANVGNHAIYFSKFLNPNEVYPFEPHEESINTLIENCRINNTSNINLNYLGYCVSDKSGESYQIENHDEENLGGTSFEKLAKDGTKSVKSICIDDIFTEFNVHLIKIDVEGMELSVLKGATKTIANSKPIISIEVTKESLKSSHEFLTNLGYHIHKEFCMYENVWTLIYTQKLI